MMKHHIRKWMGVLFFLAVFAGVVFGVLPGMRTTAEAETINLGTLTGNYEAQNGDVLTGTQTTKYQITIADGATVTLSNVTINGKNDRTGYPGITCNGNVTIKLEGNNTVKSWGQNIPGIRVIAGKTMTIEGTGSLTAGTYSTYAAGIGAGNTASLACGNIVINGGTITSIGGSNAAGIGGGGNSSANCGNITINSGTVTATGGQAGIGGGQNGYCGDITITGGTVTATATGTAGTGGAGIGAGRAYCGNITITGGTVTATGSKSGAGIGASNTQIKNNAGQACGNITITDGVTKVIATRGSYSDDAIGSRAYYYCGDVTIGGTRYKYWDSESGSNQYEGTGATYLTRKVLVYPEPDLSIEAPSFDDAYAGYDKPAAKAIKITNGGSGDAVITAIELVSDDNYFVLNPTTGKTIARGTTDETYTIQPKSGLPVKSDPYEAAIKITCEDGTVTTADVTFKVKPAPTYTLTVTAPTFDPVDAGYAQPDAKPITIKSTGNTDATISSVELSGDGADSFTLMAGTPSVTAGGTNTTYTIQPNAGLNPGTYTATITVTYNEDATTSNDVTFLVRSYDLTVTAPTFEAVDVGYDQPAAQAITITSTGNSDATISSVGLSGTNSDSFTLITEGASPSVPAGGQNTSYSIQPVTDLDSGIYTATITVNYAGGATATADVSFKVKSYTLSVTAPTFNSVKVGYDQPAAQGITITNTGNSDVTIRSVALSPGSTFILNKTDGTTITVGSTDNSTYTIQPVAGISTLGTYDETITVTYDGDATATAVASFTVEEATYTLSVTAPAFDDVDVGYTQPEAQAITITSTGNSDATISSVELSGTNKDSFTLTTGTPSVAAGGVNTSYKIQPDADLEAGNYTATITVTYNGGATATANVSFMVRSYTLSVTAPTFDAVDVGYAQPAAQAITITNSGNSDATISSVVLSGTNKDSFTLTTGTPSVAAGGNNTSYTIQPSAGLEAGNYTATITVTYNGGATETADVSFMVRSYTLSVTAPTFDAVDVGYTQPAAQAITITSTGNSDATISSVELSGTNKDSFTLTTGTPSVIAGGENTSYKIQPNAGLEAGNYTATITVTYNGEATETADVSFMVRSYTLSVTAPTFDAVDVGYVQPAAQAITITNSGNSDATISSVELSGTNKDSFTLTTGTPSVAAGGENTSYKIQPNAGLEAGNYTATIIVTYDGEATATADVSFMVRSYTLSVTAPTFDAVDEGYAQPDAKAITITNSGNSQATIASVALSGDTADSFTVISPDPENPYVPADGGTNTSYSIQPVTGLNSGIYTATITVTYDGGATATADVNFKVKSYTLSVTAPIFDNVIEGYSRPDAQAITITSSGNSDATITSALLSGDGAAAFELNKIDGTTIAAGTTDNSTYKVQPAEGLTKGTYTATITFTYNNSATAVAEVSFTVEEETYTLTATAPNFDNVIEGYTRPDAQAITITSSGNSDATITSALLSGDGAAAFELNKTDGTTIAAGTTDNSTYKVQPAEGLTKGTYTATITFTYNNDATVTANVSFTVNDDEAVTKVKDLIDALPKGEDVTLDDEDAINEAQKAYDELTDDQKKLIDEETLKKLTDAEEALEALKDKEKKDQEAADKVKNLIDALPKPEDVKQTDAEAIEAARKAYDALTEDQKKLISAETLKHLTDAEEALKGKTVTYGIYEGEDGEYTKGSDGTLTFVFKRSEEDESTFDHFFGVTYNGEPLDRDKHYTAKAGSVIITLAHDFLEGLETGEHTITAVFDDGLADAHFKVISKAEPTPTPKPNPVPKTGDSAPLGLWIGLILVGLIGLGTFIALRRRTQKK